MEIPDAEIIASDGTLAAPAVQRQFCNLIAFVIDSETGSIVNVDSYPMSEVAQNHFTAEMYYKMTGVTDITIDNDNTPVAYYNLNGIRVNQDKLTPGIYILRQSGKSTKVIIK
jgi:hypothetical protein